VDKGKATPLHIHADSDESTYVLEGEILMHIDGTEHRVSAGGLAVAPRGVPHAFMVLSDARLLFLHTPGCCQEFYWDASVAIGSESEVPGPVDFSRVEASANRNGGIELLGPPPFSQP